MSSVNADTRKALYE